MKPHRLDGYRVLSEADFQVEEDAAMERQLAGELQSVDMTVEYSSGIPFARRLDINGKPAAMCFKER